MHTTPSKCFFAWLAMAGGALALALIAPDESTFMGRLPGSFVAKRLDQQVVAIPSGLPAERTLALVVFHRGHAEEAESWIRGLRLRQDRSIAWLKLTVLKERASEAERRQVEAKLLARHAKDADHVVPVFTDQDAFVRAVKLSGTGHAAVLVLDRSGAVLARAEGAYDEDKAAALRELLTGGAL